MPITTTGRATDFITFTRTSNATVTGADGRIRWAGHNLLTNSESFDASAWGKYLTTVTANSTAAPNGTTTADTIVASSSNGTIYQSSVIPVGTSTFSCWFKAGTLTSVKVIFDGGAGTGREATFTLSGSGTAGAVANSGSGAGTLSGGTSSITPLADGWYLCTIAGVTTTAAAGLTLLLATSGNVIAWGAHLYRSDLGGMVLNPARGDAYYPTTPRNLVGSTEDFFTIWGRSGISALGSGSIANAIIAPNGLQTADKLAASAVSGVHIAQQPFSTMVSGTTYIASVYVKAAEYSKVGIRENATTGAFATFNLVGSGSVISSGAGGTGTIAALSDGWYRISMSSAAGSANYNLTISLLDNGYTSGSPASYTFTGDGVSGLYLWGAQLSDSASLDAYSPVYGAAVTSAAYYAPRLDYNANGSALGLLVEEQRVNLFKYSNDFSQSDWTKNTSTVTAASGTSPDGTNNAWRWLSDAGSTSHYLAQQYSQTSGRIYTVSAWVKTNTGSNQTFRMFGESTSASSDLTATTQWQRFSHTWTATSTSSFTIAGVVRNAANGASDLLVYGMQIDSVTGGDAPFMTSYIPTGASTATRTADVASVSTQAFPYSSTVGTIVFSADTASNGNAAVFSIGTTVSDIIRGFRQVDSQPSFQVVLGGAFQANIGLGGSNWPQTSVARMASAYAADNFAAAVNGNAATADTSGSVPSVNTLSLGSAAGLSALNGHIRQITYIPRRLSNSELQARTV